MATKPSLPDDEQPLDAATVDLLLSNIGTDMILVGEQALAFWMDRFGVDADGAVVRDSVEAEWRRGRFIRVMDPFDVLESRAQNAVGLYEDKGPHVMTQAKWAIEVARATLRRLAADPASSARLGSKLQRIHTLARSQVGRRLWAEHRVELLAAIDIDALEAAAPRLARQLEAIRMTLSARPVAGRKPSPR